MAEQLKRINAFMYPLVVATLVVMGCAFSLWFKWLAQVREDELTEKRRLVDAIVAGLLPPPIVRRLKGGERAIADFRPLATVLFMDICGASGRPPV